MKDAGVLGHQRVDRVIDLRSGKARVAQHLKLMTDVGYLLASVGCELEPRADPDHKLVRDRQGVALIAVLVQRDGLVDGCDRAGIAADEHRLDRDGHGLARGAVRIGDGGVLVVDDVPGLQDRERQLEYERVVPGVDGHGRRVTSVGERHGAPGAAR